MNDFNRIVKDFSVTFDDETEARYLCLLERTRIHRQETDRTPV